MKSTDNYGKLVITNNVFGLEKLVDKQDYLCAVRRLYPNAKDLGLYDVFDNITYGDVDRLILYYGKGKFIENMQEAEEFVFNFFEELLEMNDMDEIVDNIENYDKEYDELSMHVRDSII